MKTEKKVPRLTLVGAGPGDPGLISLKGIQAIEAADVILYDALVNTELLEYASENVIKVFVGKRNNNHSYSQEQINALIVDLAFTHGHVVRLKGGDPFVFGRGYEELTHAEIFNIETVIVPGISSSIAVPALQRIPVTNRGTSESLWVITGTTSKNKLSSDIALAAQSSATIVILMGLNKLNEITEIFRKFDRGNSAVAVIQNGSLPDEHYATGTIDTIEEVVVKENIKAPAIIVIGEVVKLHSDFRKNLLQYKVSLN